MAEKEHRAVLRAHSGEIKDAYDAGVRLFCRSNRHPAQQGPIRRWAEGVVSGNEPA